MHRVRYKRYRDIVTAYILERRLRSIRTGTRGVIHSHSLLSSIWYHFRICNLQVKPFNEETLPYSENKLQFYVRE